MKFRISKGQRLNNEIKRGTYSFSVKNQKQKKSFSNLHKNTMNYRVNIIKQPNKSGKQSSASKNSKEIIG